MISLKKIVIIGPVGNKESGPGSVVNSLIKGLNEKNIEYTLIDSYSKNIIEKLLIYIKIVLLIFSKDKIVNVHTYGYKIPYLVYKISIINKKNKYFLTIHGITSYEYMLNKKDISNSIIRMEKIIYSRFPNIICVSKYLMELYKNQYKRTNNVYYIYNGLLNPNNTYIQKKEELYIYAGGFSKLKNPIETIHLFKNIIDYYNSDSKLIICGEKKEIDLYTKTIDLIKKYNLEDKIVLYNKLSKKELDDIYMKAKYVIALSKFDTFNMTVLEAMSFGCIPIVSNKCGVKDLIDKNTGIIFNDERDISILLNQISSDIASKNSFIKAQNHSYKNMADDYLKLMGVDEK